MLRLKHLHSHLSSLSLDAPMEFQGDDAGGATKLVDGRRPSSRSNIAFNRGTFVLMRRSCRWRKCRRTSEKVSEVPFSEEGCCW